MEQMMSTPPDESVLIIDDSPTELLLLSGILQNAGVTVRVYSDPAAGLLSALEQTPSLALLDMTMPGITGMEICQKLKSDPATRHVPVIFCTARADTESMLNGFNAGAVDFIRKPYSAGEVVARVNVHLDLCRTRLELEQTISELRQSEAALTNAKDYAENIIDTANTIVVGLDLDGKITIFNEAAERITGYSRMDLDGKNWFEVLVPRDRYPDVWERFAGISQNGFPKHFENPIMTKTGEERFIVWQNSVVFDHEKAAGTISFGLDITERQRAEEELRCSRAQLSIAVEVARLGPWEYDIAADRFTFNDHFYGIFRTTAEAVGGYTMSASEYATRFVHPESADLVEAETRKAIETDDPYFNRQLEHRIMYADGSIGYMSVCFFIVKDASGKTVKTYGVNQDITERRQAEEERRKYEQQLYLTQKLESLGVLAGGIAHDFNNLLGGIFGYMDLARDASDPNGKAAGYLGKSLKTYARAKDLTQQLLTFAKGGAPTLRVGSIESLVKDATQFALSGSKVSCVFTVDDNPGVCEFDENQLGQVIDNIVINAVQAMPLGGTLSVGVGSSELAEGESVRLKAGRYIKCSFTDTGIGIPADIITRIFDPFFTTKQKGNGLGLATAYSIIQKHNGDITVESVPGKGTTFRVYLPASMKPPSSSSDARKLPHQGTGIVLIMDDEDYIREIVGEMVEVMGYTAEYANHGQDVLDRIRTVSGFDKRIKAVIMDLTVPGGMGGMEAIGELRKRCPLLPVFVASGYSDDPVMADPAAFGFTGKICKPFRIEELKLLFSQYLI